MEWGGITSPGLSPSSVPLTAEGVPVVQSIQNSHFRVVKPFKCKKGRTNIWAEAGKVVDIQNLAEAQRLMSTGYIEPLDIPFSNPESKILPMPSRLARKRVGIWLITSDFYSGGRIHLWQYAWCLADSGAEVFLITNANPKWESDYPKTRGINVVIMGRRNPPEDLDIIVTDSKGDVGMDLLRYMRRHPMIPLACMNFETPNWVEKFVPDYAKKLNLSQQNKGTFEKADVLMANSKESAKYLLEWLGKPPTTPTYPILPAVNEFALGWSTDPNVISGAKLPSKPYAVYSARPVAYKGFDLVVDAIWSLKVPMDLVVFGRPPNAPPRNSLHEMYSFSGQQDKVKFAAMRGATMMLSPSLFEGAGMTPMEAMSVGTPVIVFDLPVLREIYGDRLIYCKWGDKDQFKATVAEVLRRKTKDA